MSRTSISYDSLVLSHGPASLRSLESTQCPYSTGLTWYLAHKSRHRFTQASLGLG